MTNYNDEQIEIIWRKGRIIPNFDQNVWRWDDIGNVMFKSAYGQMENKYGWNVDHIVPQSMGGLDVIENLRPLNCYTNSVRQDGRF